MLERRGFPGLKLMTQLDTWTNCYDLNWKNLITPAAFSHPAKFSHGLIKRIYDHALQDGLIQPGGVVLDPFGGVGLGALYAMQNGLHWVGCELEPRFVELARENIALWNARYAAHFPNWGSAQVLQGDSRRLCEVVGAAGLVVGSPPYSSGTIIDHDTIEKYNELKSKIVRDGKGHAGKFMASADGYGSAPGQLGAMKSGEISAVIASPPFAGNTGGRGEASRNGIDAALFDRHSGGMKKGTGDDPANLDHLPQGNIGAVIGSPPYVGGGHHNDQTGAWGGAIGTGQPTGKDKSVSGYGETDGQLGAMKPGEISAVIASPPFADSVGSDDPDKRGGLFRDEKRRNDVNLTGTYGETEGQLGGMKAAVIGSPPYAESLQNHGAERAKNLEGSQNGLGDYGSTDGQIGATQGQTFWEAARLIVEQCALLLPVGGAAIWVTKRYVKDGKIVDFSQQWAQLCEACGFEIVHWHRAMLVKDNGEQETMADGHDTAYSTTNLLGEETAKGGKPLANKKNIVARKSFFRRLAEKNGSPPIDWEDVICTRKKAA